MPLTTADVVHIPAGTRVPGTRDLRPGSSPIPGAAA